MSKSMWTAPPAPVLVTGASGFVGGYLVPALVAAGRPVRAMVRVRARGRRLMGRGVDVVCGDLLDSSSLVKAVQGCGAVVHLAAVADSSDEDLNRRVNVDGSRNLAEALITAGVRRVINLSSTCAGRRMQDAYGRTKRDAEAVFDPMKLDVTHLRPTMIYGHGSKEFDLFAKVVAVAPRVPIPGDGRSRLRPVYVEDAVELLIKVLESRVALGRTYDVAGPESLSFDAFIELLGAAQGRVARPLHVPAPLALGAARLLGKVLPHPPINVDQVMAFLQDTEVDIEPVQRDLAWDPRPLREGLTELFGGNA